jgi:hypothetical protein
VRAERGRGHARPGSSTTRNGVATGTRPGAHGRGQRAAMGGRGQGQARPGRRAGQRGTTKERARGEGGIGRGEGERGGELTSGLDDRDNRPPDHLGQRRWTRGGREGEEVAAREKKMR